MRRNALIVALVLFGLPVLGAATAEAPSPATAETASPSPVAAVASRPVAEAAQQPRCFGAVARDPLQPCHNPRLRLSVVPRPADARKQAAAPCPTVGEIVDVPVCSFGVDASRARRFVALVGDSHAGMWRMAMTHVAVELEWTGLRIGHSSCPLSKAFRNLQEPKRSHCARWKRAVFKWFKRHPEVDTLVVSQLTGGSGVVATGGRSEFETSVAGYRAAWRALPNIEHIVVIRDTPKAEAWTPACIERAMARRKPAGLACANPRRTAIDPDPAAAAARRVGTPRVHVVDLTKVFCGPRSCLPVIGGALVYTDTTHLTAAFAATLGEPLLRRIAPLARSWR